MKKYFKDEMEVKRQALQDLKQLSEEEKAIIDAEIEELIQNPI